MVGKSRFGGIFSILNRRDLQTIRNVETYLELVDPDIEEDMLYLAGDKIQTLSIDEIIEGLESYIRDIKIDRGEFTGSSDNPYSQELAKENREYQISLERDLSSAERAQIGEEKGRGRYWEGQLQPIIRKLKSFKDRLQNKELR